MSVIGMEKKKKRKAVDAATLDFARDHVVNITDITRTKKLSEIMDYLSTRDGRDDVYIIQNSKKKDTAVVLAEVEHYKELLKYKERFDQLQDQLVEMEAIARLEANPDESVSFEDMVESLNDEGIEIDFHSLNSKLNSDDFDVEED